MKHDRIEKDSSDLQALRREAGRWLREKRDEARLTQRQLADGIGIDYYTFISQIEAGRGRVPPERYQIYAEVLKVDPREFATTMLKYNEPYIFSLIFGEDKEITAPPASDVETRLKRLEAALART